jgi:hypothetical protein
MHECITALLRQVNQNFRVYFYVTELELDSRLLVKLKQFMAERGDVRFEYIEDRPGVSGVGSKEGWRERDRNDYGDDDESDDDNNRGYCLQCLCQELTTVSSSSSSSLWLC